MSYVEGYRRRPYLRLHGLDEMVDVVGEDEVRKAKC